MVDVEYLTVDEAAQTLRCVKRDKIYLWYAQVSLRVLSLVAGGL